MQISSLVGCWCVCNETNALHLTNIVKSNDSDEWFWVSSFSFSKLLQHLRRISGSKQWQLPHCPVTSIIVSWWTVVLTVHKSFLYNTKQIIQQINTSTLQNSLLVTQIPIVQSQKFSAFIESAHHVVVGSRSKSNDQWCTDWVNERITDHIQSKFRK